MDLVIFLHAPFVEFRFSRVPLYLTVLYSGVRRKFQFNGFNSIFLAYTNVCSVTSGGGYSHILVIQVCAGGKGVVFKLFTLG